jgi:hypothetical protein
MEVAREDYARVSLAEDGVKGGSPYSLAQKRLATIGKPSPETATPTPTPAQQKAAPTKTQ